MKNREEGIEEINTAKWERDEWKCLNLTRA